MILHLLHWQVDFSPSEPPGGAGREWIVMLAGVFSWKWASGGITVGRGNYFSITILEMFLSPVSWNHTPTHTGRSHWILQS